MSLLHDILSIYEKETKTILITPLRVWLCIGSIQNDPLYLVTFQVGNNVRSSLLSSLYIYVILAVQHSPLIPWQMVLVSHVCVYKVEAHGRARAE